MITYPAITIWQPWASLIQAAAKPYEWRGWAAPKRLVGRRIAIHAGARKVVVQEIQELIYLLDRHGEAGTSLIPEVAKPLLERWSSAPGMLPLSSVLCTAVLGEPIPATLYAAGKNVADSDRIDHTKWGWPLTEIETLEPFQPAKGMQGIWNWTMGNEQ